MLKKLIVSILAATSLISTAFAAVDIKSYQIDGESNVFSVVYDYTADNEVSIAVYDVSQIENPTIDTEYVNNAITPIIQLAQENGDGQFDLKVNPDYTGRVIVALGSNDGTFKRALLKIENGTVRSITIPGSVSELVDADGLTKVLGNEESLTISTSGLLLDAVVDAKQGTLIIGTTNVKGKVRFDTDGRLTVDVGENVILESETVDGKRNIGFINGVNFAEAKDTRTMTITGGGKIFTKTYDTPGMTGNMVFTGAVQNVPESILSDGFVMTVN